MAARRKGRLRETEDDDIGTVDADTDDLELPDDLIGSIDSDDDTDFPDEPPEGWPSG